MVYTTQLPHELPNDLKLRKLGEVRKISKLHRNFIEIKILLILAKNY